MRVCVRVFCFIKKLQVVGQRKDSSKEVLRKRDNTEYSWIPKENFRKTKGFSIPKPKIRKRIGFFWKKIFRPAGSSPFPTTRPSKGGDFPASLGCGNWAPKTSIFFTYGPPKKFLFCFAKSQFYNRNFFQSLCWAIFLIKWHLHYEYCFIKKLRVVEEQRQWW